ncbi:hypothetical protein ACA910_012833 [Epithemia clementina (nom. ined.)]
MASVRKKEIRAALEKAGMMKMDDNILSKCIALATSTSLSPDQMGLFWESFSLNRNLSHLDDHCFESFRTALIKYADERSNTTPDSTITSRPTKRSTPPPSVTPPAKRKTTLSGEDGVPTANDEGRRRVSLSPDVPVNKGSGSTALYDDRKGAGKVMETWNPNNLPDAGTEQRSNKPRCTVSRGDFSTNTTHRYRYMNTTVEEVAEMLNERLVQLGQMMKERYALGEDSAIEGEGSTDSIAALEAVGVSRQEPICCIGRICNEAHEGRLNATSILLEGCRGESGGTRVKLDMSHLKANKTPFLLFPGQIVAVEGLNPSGRTMVAHRICDGTPPFPVQTTADELLKFHHGDNYQGGSPLNIMAVSGPFATSSGLNYQPLWDFVNKVQSSKPDVVVMTGPFVDMRQEAMKSGQTIVQNDDGSETLLPLETFFAEQISAVLQEFFSGDEVGTQFVLVPSLHDATAEWVFPQPPFADAKRNPSNDLSRIPGAENLVTVGTLDLDTVNVGRKRVHYMSNPCTFKINELVVSVTSTDIFLHMGISETNANLPPGSRLEYLAKHLLLQHSFYPLFPPIQGTNLDMKKLDQIAIPCQPDILITPSKLNPFARTALENTLVVNPGFLTKSYTGGTFATIQVHPIKRETLEEFLNSGVELPNAVASRSKVDIIRI